MWLVLKHAREASAVCEGVQCTIAVWVYSVRGLVTKKQYIIMLTSCSSGSQLEAEHPPPPPFIGGFGSGSFRDHIAGKHTSCPKVYTQRAALERPSTGQPLLRKH